MRKIVEEVSGEGLEKLLGSLIILNTFKPAIVPAS